MWIALLLPARKSVLVFLRETYDDGAATAVEDVLLFGSSHPLKAGKLSFAILAAFFFVA